MNNKNYIRLSQLIREATTDSTGFLAHVCINAYLASEDRALTIQFHL